MQQEDLMTSIQLAKQEIPVPWETKPINNDIMVKYGLDNLYPLFLLNLYLKSPIHQSIVNTKASYIIGSGLRRKDGGELNLRPNPIDSMDSFLDKIVKDFLIFNNFCVEVQYNDFTYQTEALAYNHIPAQNIRVNKDKSLFYYSEDWALRRTDQYVYQRWMQDNPDPSSKLFYFEGYIPTKNRVYPEPEYSACIEAIVTNISIQTFNRNNIVNNFSPSKLVTYYLGENVPNHIQRDVKNKLEKHFSGDGEKWMLIFANPGQEKIKIENIDPNTWDAAYEVTRTASIDDIYEGHGFNPALMGKGTPGKLSNTQELELSYEILKSNYIESKRKQIESGLSLLFGFEVEFVEKSLFKTRVSESTREKILTINELRALEGLDPIDGGDRMIGTNQQQATPLLQSQTFGKEATLEDFEKIKHIGFDKNEWLWVCDGNEETLQAIETFNGEKLNTVVTVMYDYKVRDTAAPLLTESRPFCQAVESSNRYYTRSDIQQMSNILGWDVYKYGGRFYHNPVTGITTQECRHFWKPVIVRQNK